MSANALLATLRHHVTGAIERGEAQAITEIPASHVPTLGRSSTENQELVCGDERNLSKFALSGTPEGLQAIQTIANHAQKRKGETHNNSDDRLTSWESKTQFGDFKITILCEYL
jgi:hypothetical protein